MKKTNQLKAQATETGGTKPRSVALAFSINGKNIQQAGESGAKRVDDFIIDLPANHKLRKRIETPEVRKLLGSIAEHSPYLWQLSQKDPDRLERLLSKPANGSLSSCLRLFEKSIIKTSEQTDVMRQLRVFKQELHLLIALADLSGVWSVDQVVAAITSMADCAVSAALSFLLREAASEGNFELVNANKPGEQSGLFILALGKHGARELNYSSDVDLIVFFDPEKNAIPDSKDAAAIFVRITRSLIKLLQETTEDGYALRVDLRLRPDPGSTAVAISLNAAYSYYESVGQNWERAAYIKARPVAGDIQLGQKFLDNLKPFIWRKYFDYAAIADIHAMKRQIHAVRGHGEIATAGHDIKLGRGGIREVEFFVQTQQLIFGGRRPALRGSQTLTMLAALCQDKWITARAAKELSHAYRFLRTVEHRLQMQIDEQTQRLPTSEEELQKFAQFCGYESLMPFTSELVCEMKNVERHYARLFEHAPALSSEIGNLVFTGSTDDPATIETLRKLGFLKPEQATETIRGWYFGRRAGIQSSRTREVLTDLVPGLIEAFSGSGDPDAALRAFDDALAHMPASMELLSILKSNAPVRELFGDILGGAPNLAQVIAQRPHVLDAAIDPSFIENTRGEDYFNTQVSRINTLQDDTEIVLDAMRDIALEESFLIGIRMFGGSIDAADAGEQYSGLASALIRAALDHILFVFEKDHGTVAGGTCLILGLGKLGSREMTATSDLDLIMLYNYDEENPKSNGARPLHANQYYARLTQRLLSALTVPTRRGPLYEVDMRLRPSGGQGPVATNLRSFREYQSKEAEIWEHMALSRARVIAGDGELAIIANEEISAIIKSNRDKNELCKAIVEMRQLIAESKGDDNRWDLKQMSGGLIDIEFIAQYITLQYSSKVPSLYNVSTLAVLKNAYREGVLSADDASILQQAHQFYSAIMQTLCLVVDRDFDPATLPSGVLRRISAAVNLPDIRTVEREISAYRQKVRSVFLAMLNEG
jgi:[glutamine synthetase] adenylyltransferase / [glutamine synthetase]-adenylyl-L-tyrosine phosphorylase